MTQTLAGDLQLVVCEQRREPGVEDEGLHREICAMGRSQAKEAFTQAFGGIQEPLGGLQAAASTDGLENRPGQ